jgi:hypothetical protein
MKWLTTEKGEEVERKLHIKKEEKLKAANEKGRFL